MAQSCFKIYPETRGFKEANELADIEGADTMIEIDRELFKKSNATITIAISNLGDKSKLAVELKENEARHLAEYIISVINARC